LDPTCPGLSARVTPKGRITWSLRLRVVGEGGRSARGHRPKGQQYRLTLGAYPGVSIKQVRALASDYLRQAEAGSHPVRALERKAVDRHETLEQLAGCFLEDYAKPNLRSWQNAQSVFRRHLVPAWGRLPMDTIDERDAARLLNQVAKGGLDPDTNKHVPRPGAASEVLKWGRRLFSWAVQSGMAHSNPFERTKPAVRLKPRQRFLDIHEARAVWKAAGELDYPWRELVQLLMLTGCRLREVGHSRWSWVNLTEMRIAIPADAYKTGRPHLVALPSGAVDILKSLPRWNGGNFPFSTSNGIQPIWGIPRKVVDELHSDAERILGREIEHFVIHDLRRTVRTHLSRLKVPEVVGELILGHALRGIAGTYNVYDFEAEKRESLNLWASELLPCRALDS
jgi:integrase